MLETLTDLIRQKAPGGAHLGAVVQFSLGATGVVVLDTKQSPPVVHNQATQADCTIQVSPEDLHGMLTGTSEVTTLFMMGRLSVEGDMGVAMKLADFVRS
jgi:putative sterol carrier protein